MRTSDTQPSVHNLLQVVLEHPPRIRRRALVRHELHVAFIAALFDGTRIVVLSHVGDDQRAQPVLADESRLPDHDAEAVDIWSQLCTSCRAESIGGF